MSSNGGRRTFRNIHAAPGIGLLCSRPGARATSVRELAAQGEVHEPRHIRAAAVDRLCVRLERAPAP